MRGGARRHARSMADDGEIQGLLAQAAKAYASENFEAAAELYAAVNEAAEAAGHVEPDFLFLYGRALWRAAAAAGDVLGGAEDEEQSDLEAAWEVLELARTLYEEALSASGDAVVQQKLAETYDVLGEVSLEAENFGQAAEDLRSCLALRERSGAAERLLVEAHYKLALALEYVPGGAAECCAQLQRCVDMLGARVAAGTGAPDDGELLAELQQKLADVAAQPPAAEVAPDALAGLREQLASAAVNDLTSRVRRRGGAPDGGQ